MSKDGIRVEEFNIYSLGAEAVSYHLKDIHTLALQITSENIGGLALEFETELIYSGAGEPYLNIYVARGTKEEPEDDRNLIVRPGDWFVILWDEIHLFRDKEFRSTFSFDGLSAPRMTDEDVKELSKHLNAPEVPQTVITKHENEIAESTAWSSLPPGKYVKLFEMGSGRKLFATTEAWDFLADDVKRGFRLDGLAFEVPPPGDSEKTQIVPASGNLYPEGEGTGASPETERKIGERIDSQPWMQQARAELAEKDGGNTREQQL